MSADTVSAFDRATLADYTEQASVTNWPARIALVLIVIGLIVLALWGMRRGWQGRQRRQAWIPAPSAPPEGIQGMSDPVPGLFIGSAMHGDWMDRIAVHDLGVRSRGEISHGEGGILFEREGARDLYIPSSAVVSVRTDRGTAGTVRARDSVIVISWHLGDAIIDTGFRADDTAAHAAVLDGLMATFDAGMR